MHLEDAVRQGDMRGDVDVIDVGVKDLGRRQLRRPIDPAHDLRRDLVAKLPDPFLRLQRLAIPERFICVAPAIMPVLDRGKDLVAQGVDDRVLQRQQCLADRREDEIGRLARDEDEPPVLLDHGPNQPGRFDHQLQAAGPGDQLVGRGVAVTQAPGRGTLAEQDRSLGPGHDPAQQQLGEAVAPTGLVEAAPGLPPLQQRDHLVGRVAPRRPEVAPKDALAPGSLIALVRHERHADLNDGERQGVVGLNRPIAGLDPAVEQEAPVDPFEVG